MRYLPGTTTPRPGANFKFCWNPTVGNPSKAGNPLSAYPGASYVDMIGLDIYDISPRYKQGYDAQGLPATDPNIVYYYGESDMPVWMRDTIRTNAWKDQAIWGLYHLDWWRSQVRTSGSSVYSKPLCIPEWGLDQPGEKSSLHLQGGRDNPIFLQNFYNWITNPQYNDVSWVAYFERGNQSPERNTSLCFSNQFPIARNLFLQLF